jgi:hypothetical protein
MQLGKYQRCVDWQKYPLYTHRPWEASRHSRATDCSAARLAAIETEYHTTHHGDRAIAEAAPSETLGLRKTALGKKHLSTLTSISNLANALRDQGKYEEAKEIHRQGLGLRETVLGEEHPDTVTSMNNLALVLRDRSKCEEGGRDASTSPGVEGDGARQRASSSLHTSRIPFCNSYIHQSHQFQS